MRPTGGGGPGKRYPKPKSIAEWLAQHDRSKPPPGNTVFPKVRPNRPMDSTREPNPRWHRERKRPKWN